MLNDALFVEVLARIEREPLTWDQNWWSYRTGCGTTFCFAGHACDASGVELQYLDDGACDMTVDGDFVGRRAAELLGLDVDGRESHVLFSAPNDLATVYRIVSNIMGVAPEVLRDKVQDRLRP